MSTKLDVLTSLADICDQLIVGGGIANTFLAAAGYKVGKSLHEADLLDTAKRHRGQGCRAAASGCGGRQEFAESAEATVKAIGDVADDDMILDIGPKTAAMFGEMLKASQTILWNGPVGVFEFDQFGNGTKVLAQAIAQSPAFSIAGGGDTLAAIDKYGVAEQISISTGGGAFLEFVEGKVLPAVEVLEQRARLMAGRAAGGAPRRWPPADADGNPAARRGLCSYRNKERGFAMRYVAVAVCCLGLAVAPAVRRTPPRCSTLRRCLARPPNTTSALRCRPPAIRPSPRVVCRTAPTDSQGDGMNKGLPMLLAALLLGGCGHWQSGPDAVRALEVPEPAAHRLALCR